MSDAGGLAEGLARPPQVVAKGPRCTVAVIAAGLADADRVALLDAINGAAWRTQDLSAFLRDRGIDLPHYIIRRHRLQQCACHKLAPDLVGP